MDALPQMSDDFACWIVETEYWGAIADPNLAIESSLEDVADLMAATAFHVGEVERNPYHLRLPAWMADNVRRGGELVGSVGGTAPSFTFATLYRARQWQHQQFKEDLTLKQSVSCQEDLSAIFKGFIKGKIQSKLSKIERFSSASRVTRSRLEKIDNLAKQQRTN
jgi:hypothetical protein